MGIKINYCITLLLLLLFVNTLVFAQELYPVKKDSLWGYINNKGRLEIPLMYSQAFYFSEGLAIVKKDGKVGIIDAKNNSIIPLTEKYLEIYYIHKGIALTLNRDSSSTVFDLERLLSHVELVEMMQFEIVRLPRAESIIPHRASSSHELMLCEE